MTKQGGGASSPVLGLKVDVDTFEGLRRGVPRLLRLLERRNLRASFFVPGGPDRSGRAIGRLFHQPGFLSKMRRTGGLRLYGPVTALRGTLLPAVPMTRGRAELRAIVAAGHDLGVHGWDHVAWHDGIHRAAYADILHDLSRAREALAEASGRLPVAVAAPGWNCCFRSLHAQEALGFLWASDTRGREPFRPRCEGFTFRAPQLPTTLPTLDEVWRAGEAPRALSARYADWIATRPWQILTAHAELEGGAALAFLEDLLDRLAAAGVRVVSVGQLFDELPGTLPESGIVRGRLPGRAGSVSLQEGGVPVTQYEPTSPQTP